MMSHDRSAQAADGEWKEELDASVGEVREKLATAGDTVIDFIKRRPVPCLVGALAVGYIFGRLVRR